MARIAGSRNLFKHLGIDPQQIVNAHYGAAFLTVARKRKDHIGSKKGCHVCMEAVEMRLLGKPPQEIKHSGGRIQPIVLVSVTQGVPAEIPLEESDINMATMIVDGEIVKGQDYRKAVTKEIAERREAEALAPPPPPDPPAWNAATVEAERLVGWSEEMQGEERPEQPDKAPSSW